MAPSEQQWKREMVVIKTLTGEKVQVPAWVRGSWAIHKGRCPDGHLHPNLWQVRHVPTGRGMPWKLRSLSLACRLASNLDKLADWSQIKRGQVSAELGSQCADVAVRTGVFD